MVVSVNKHMWQVYRNITVIVQSIIFVTIYNFYQFYAVIFIIIL